MKRHYLSTALSCLLILALAFGVNAVSRSGRIRGSIRIGFLFENDEATPYTYNFSLARDALEHTLQDRVEILTMSNVLASETDEPIRSLVRQGCRMIFSNGSSDQILTLAESYPEVTFCQASYFDAAGMTLPENYHSFKGAIHEVRYASGVAAGLKLRELIDSGKLAPEDAWAGYVAAFPYPEVISGYTAFLLGIRSVAPEARLRVRYANTWSHFSEEKATAEQLIADGCTVLAYDTDTIGPVVACEEADHPVYVVGYNVSMMDIAPNSALLSVRINWAPYVVAAVKAVLEGRDIERALPGSVHGNDVCAGLKQDWVELMELNPTLIAPGTQEKLAEVTEGIIKGSLPIFQGEYTGVNPDDESDVIDLKNGYTECSTSSCPTFRWILRDVIEIETEPETA